MTINTEQLMSIGFIQTLDVRPLVHTLDRSCENLITALLLAILFGIRVKQLINCLINNYSKADRRFLGIACFAKLAIP